MHGFCKRYGLRLENQQQFHPAGDHQVLSRNFEIAPNVQGQVNAAVSNILAVGLAVKVLDPDSDVNYLQVGFDHATLTNSRIGLYRWIPQVEALFKLNQFARFGFRYSYDNSKN